MEAYEDVTKSHGFTRLEALTLPFVKGDPSLLDAANEDVGNKLRNDPGLMMYSDDPATVFYLKVVRPGMTRQDLRNAFRDACRRATSSQRSSIMFIFVDGRFFSAIETLKSDPEGPSTLDGVLKRRHEYGRSCVMCLNETGNVACCRYCTATMCDDCLAKVIDLDNRCPLCRQNTASRKTP